ncbi:MAG: hypothetical protein WC975_07795 [Phycisphaerae bacterium]
MKINEKDRRAIIFGVAGLGVILLYLLIVGPLIDSYDTLIGTHQQLSSKVGKILRDNKKTKYLSETIKAWEDKTGCQTAVKPYSEQITVLGDRIMTAGQCGVQIKNSNWVAPRIWPDDPSLEMAQIQLEAEGDWERVCTFLAALYRTDGIFSIERMDLQGSPKKDGKVTVRLTVSVLVEAGKQHKDNWTR